MKIHNVEQGSPEWLACRIGLPTASEFHQIITPKTLKMSSSTSAYAVKLATEMVLGHALERDLSHNLDVQRGIDMEPHAALVYEFETDTTTTSVGFITDDAGTYGASPDRLVEQDGLLEIKCPRPEKHALYLLNGFGADYMAQVQGQLLVTGRQWCDRYSYCPGLPPYRERTIRDEAFITALDAALAEVHALKLSYLKKLQDISNQEMPV